MRSLRGKGLALRLGFDAVLEAGLRSRLGRTLETTGTAVAEVIVGEDEWHKVVVFAIEAIKANAGQLITEHDIVQTWVEGVLAASTSAWGYLPPLPRSLCRREWETLVDLGWGRPTGAQVPQGNLGSVVLRLWPVR